jgi:hypothetical protein
MSLWKRPPVRPTERERELIAFRYANPQLTVRQISGILLLQPGELNRLLRLKEGRELMHALATGSTTLDWTKYRVPARLFSGDAVREK